MRIIICSITYYFNYFPWIASLPLAVLHIWDKKILTDGFFFFSFRRGLHTALNSKFKLLFKKIQIKLNPPPRLKLDLL